MSGQITHEWNGTVLTVTSDSGTTSCDLKGEKGDTGIRGAQGVAGEQYKPQYGVDYFTDEEKGDFLLEIDSHIAQNKDALFLNETKDYVDTNAINQTELEEFVSGYVRENAVNEAYVESYVGNYVANNTLSEEFVANYVNAWAISSQTPSLTNVSVKDWAQGLTKTTYAFTDNTTLDMPAGVSVNENYAIATAKVVASGGWIELKLNYVLSGCVAVAIYNYGWGEWEWQNPPMIIGTEYRTTERYDGKAVYTTIFSLGTAAATNTFNIPITNLKKLVRYVPHNGDKTGGEWDTYGSTDAGFPINAGNAFYCLAQRDSSNYITAFIACGSIRVGYPLYLQLWYIKN